MTLDYLEITEQPFTLHRDGKPIMVGTPDSVRVYESRRIVCVFERKFGYKEVQAADANLQLRCYLTLVAEEYPADRYFGCLSQPRVSSKPQIVFYGPAEIEKARQEIFAIHDSCYAENAPRTPSPEACTYCTAQAICPEFAQWRNAVTKSEHLPTNQWSDEMMEDFLMRRTLVEKFCKDRMEDIKLIKQANPDRLPGWSLVPGNSVRTVTDLVAAWSALQSHMSAREFSDACDISIGALEKILWQRSQGDTVRGKLSQAQARALLNDLLKGLIELRRNKPSLEKE